MGKSKKNINKHLKGIGNPYRVPAAYFDTFSDRLMSKIEQEESKHNETSTGRKKLGIVKYLRPALAMAASFIIIFFMVYIPVSTISPKLSHNQEQKESLGFDYLDYYYVSSNALVEIFENDFLNEEYIQDDLVEAYLLASMSEYDFYELIE